VEVDHSLATRGPFLQCHNSIWETHRWRLYLNNAAPGTFFVHSKVTTRQAIHAFDGDMHEISKILRFGVANIDHLDSAIFHCPAYVWVFNMAHPLVCKNKRDVLGTTHIYDMCDRWVFFDNAAALVDVHIDRFFLMLRQRKARA